MSLFKNRNVKIVLILMVIFISGLAVWGLSAFRQYSAKNYGGTMTVNITPGRKLVTATWKGEEVWYLIRPMKEGEKPEILELREDSQYGILQGRIVFIEYAPKN